MDRIEREKFKARLKDLLTEFNVSIGFVCADSSDTHGIYDERIEFQEDKTNEVIVSAQGWWMDKNDID